jgi:phospholipase C
MGATVPDVPPNAVITGAEAIAIGHEVLGDLFPAMRS